MRGNARTKGEQRRKEAGNVFDEASRAAITLTFLVKDECIEKVALVHYHDIGDFLKREQKLGKLVEFKSVASTPMQKIVPNRENDWIGQRESIFSRFIPLHEKKCPTSTPIFNKQFVGASSGRDSWVYNFSKAKLTHHVKRTVDFFNDESENYQKHHASVSAKDFVRRDIKSIAWSYELFRQVERGRKIQEISTNYRLVEYRPLTKTWCYFDAALFTRIGRLSQIYGCNKTGTTQTYTICVESPGNDAFSSWIVNIPFDYHLLGSAKGYPFELNNGSSGSILSDSHTLPSALYRNSGSGIEVFRQLFPSIRIDFEVLFFYVYGLLQNLEYQSRFSANLKRELPRIPAVATSDDFLSFVECGRQLTKIHIDYERVNEYAVTENWTNPEILKSIGDKEKFRVEKMKFKSRNDKSTICYNSLLEISDVPAEAHEFRVNGKSLVEWVMDRQRISKHRENGIVNDPNDFAIETMNDPAYPLKLLKKAINIGIKTREVQKSMPPLRVHKKMGG